VLGKLGATNRTEAVTRARQLGPDLLTRLRARRLRPFLELSIVSSLPSAVPETAFSGTTIGIGGPV
jgi:hypothetical protein